MIHITQEEIKKIIEAGYIKRKYSNSDKVSPWILRGGAAVSQPLAKVYEVSELRTVARDMEDGEFSTYSEERNQC